MSAANTKILLVSAGNIKKHVAPWATGNNGFRTRVYNKLLGDRVITEPLARIDIKGRSVYLCASKRRKYE